ncbi:MAG: hypothetical protein WCH84_04180 [Verrucomicrobiota bacterium]
MRQRVADPVSLLQVLQFGGKPFRGTVKQFQALGDWPGGIRVGGADENGAVSAGAFPPSFIPARDGWEVRTKLKRLFSDAL